MIISTIDASYSGAEGVREAFVKSSDILSNFRMVEEKQLVDSLIRAINSHSGLGTYGMKEIIGLLKNNVVKTVIITDDTNMYRVVGVCKRCSDIREDILETPQVIPKKTELTSNPCPECNSMEVEASEQDVVDYLELLAAKTGTKLEVISGKAEHGLQLASLGKVGALLRYNPGHAKQS